MAKTDVADTIVLLDDELYNMTWMIDYLYSLSYHVLPASTANEALDLVQDTVYRAAIIDLNVPILSPLEEAAAELGSVYVRYPGLFVARQARQYGYRGRQVVLYSVHRDSEVTDEVRKLDCTYILKGRPREIKAEIEAVLSFDPTAE